MSGSSATAPKGERIGRGHAVEQARHQPRERHRGDDAESLRRRRPARGPGRRPSQPRRGAAHPARAGRRSRAYARSRRRRGRRRCQSRSSARPPPRTHPSSTMLKRRGPSDSLTRCSIDRTSDIGWSGSTAATHLANATAVTAERIVSPRARRRKQRPHGPDQETAAARSARRAPATPWHRALDA